MNYLIYVAAGAAFIMSGISTIEKGFTSIYGVRTEYGEAAPYVGVAQMIVGGILIGYVVIKKIRE